MGHRQSTCVASATRTVAERNEQTSRLREIRKGGSMEVSGPTAERSHDDKAYKSVESERKNHFGIYQECRPGSLAVTNGRTYRKDCGGGLVRSIRNLRVDITSTMS